MLLRKLVVSAEASLDISLGIASQKKAQQTEEEIKNKAKQLKREKKLAKKATKKKGRKGRKSNANNNSADTSNTEENSALAAAKRKADSIKQLQDNTYTSFAIPTRFNNKEKEMYKSAGIIYNNISISYLFS